MSICGKTMRKIEILEGLSVFSSITVSLVAVFEAIAASNLILGITIIFVGGIPIMGFSIWKLLLLEKQYPSNTLLQNITVSYLWCYLGSILTWAIYLISVFAVVIISGLRLKSLLGG